MEDMRESLREERIHGTTGYPLAAYDNYNRFPHFSNHLLETHWHDEVEFLIVDRGPMCFRLNDTIYTAQTGQVVIILPGVIHVAESVGGKPFLFQALVFDLSLLDNDPTDACHQKYFMHIRDSRYQLPTIVSPHDVWGKDVIDKVRTICRMYFDKSPGFELGIKSALYSIFYQFFFACQVAKKDLSGSHYEIERFKKVYEYIKQNFTRKIGIEELARISNLSKYHFIRMFKRMTGRTPLDYLNHYRMQQAAKLLEADKLKIVDIAYEVGIDDSSYFTKLFQKYFGINPSHYRLQ